MPSVRQCAIKMAVPTATGSGSRLLTSVLTMHHGGVTFSAHSCSLHMSCHAPCLSNAAPPVPLRAGPAQAGAKPGCGLGAQAAGARARRARQ